MKINLNLLFLGLLFIGCGTSTDKKSETVTDSTAQDSTALQLIDHLLGSPKYMMYETDFLNSIHYAEVCAAYGALQYSDKTGNIDLINQIAERYDPLKKDSIAWQNHHVDGNVYGILPLQLFQIFGDSSYLEHGLYLADAQWENPRPDGLTEQTRFWIDDVFMVGSLQVEAYKATRNPKYIDRAAKFTRAYIEELQQENGLFHHGNDAPIYWGRGNGWMACGMAIVLTELPKDHPDFEAIESGYKKMMNELVKYQSENGLWRQVIDLEKSWEETSCSAMFAYAMSVGINREILYEKEFKPKVEKALAALNDKVNKSGELTGVCVGTGQSTDINYYLERPTVDGDFHGQAPLLWLYASLWSEK